MALGAAVRDAFRHRVRLVPDNVLAQIPAVSLQGKGHAPRNADQVFVLDSTVIHQRFPLVFKVSALVAWRVVVSRVFVPVIPRIAIAKVQPQHAVIGQQFPHQSENLNHRSHKFCRRCFEAKLSRVPVVAQPEVRRRGHAHLHLHALSNQVAHGVPAIAEKHSIHLLLPSNPSLNADAPQAALAPRRLALR